jgi:hypothetical protein
MVMTHLMGGLGNQLYQWAFARSISNYFNEVPYLDLSFILSEQAGVTKRNFELSNFPFLSYRVSNSLDLSDKPVCYFSDSSSPEEIIVSDKFHYSLYGYFQKYGYFSKNSELIRAELRMPLDVKSHLLNTYPNLDKSTSIHIRRTDYVYSGGYHPISSTEYYQRAISEIEEYDNLLIFSDDINWCEANLKFDNMIFIKNQSPVEDLWLMSLCGNNIIANSSFSWWGAYLNDKPNRKVISPKEWFGPGIDSFMSHRIPAEWIIL